MEGLFASLAVAGLSGIAWFAYKHPEAYKAIALPTTTFQFCILCGVGLFSWRYAGSEVYSAIAPYIALDKVGEAAEAYKIFTTTTEWFAFVLAGLFLLWLYFCLLRLLPSHIKLYENGGKK